MKNNSQSKKDNDSSLPVGWEMKKIGEVCEVIAGQSPEGKFYNKNSTGLPFYQGKKNFGDKFIGAPTTWTSKTTKEAQKDDILMSVRAPVGPINFGVEKICIGRGLAAIRVSKKIDKDFLFLFLLKHENEIVGNIGAVFNSINKSQIENIKIPLPPLIKQKRIVKVLDEIFENIDKAKENVEKNLQNTRELFESYLQSIFDNNGDKWDELELEKISEKTSNIKWKEGKDYRYIDLSAVSRDTLQVVDYQMIDIHNAPSRAKKIVYKDDVIFATTRPALKRYTIIGEEFDGHICSTGFCVLRPIRDRAISNFVFYCLKLNSFMKYVESNQKGASYPAVTDAEVKRYKIKLPALKEQQTITKKLDVLSTEVKKLEAIYQQKLSDLEELKKSILQKVFNGNYELK